MVHDQGDFLQQAGHGVGVGIAANAGLDRPQSFLFSGHAGEQDDPELGLQREQASDTLSPGGRACGGQPHQAMVENVAAQSTLEGGHVQRVALRKGFHPPTGYRFGGVAQIEMGLDHRSVNAWDLARSTGLSR
jgi:hypothetical protein